MNLTYAELATRISKMSEEDKQKYFKLLTQNQNLTSYTIIEIIKQNKWK